MEKTLQSITTHAKIKLAEDAKTKDEMQSVLGNRRRMMNGKDGASDSDTSDSSDDDVAEKPCTKRDMAEAVKEMNNLAKRLKSENDDPADLMLQWSQCRRKFKTFAKSFGASAMHNETNGHDDAKETCEKLQADANAHWESMKAAPKYDAVFAEKLKAAANKKNSLVEEPMQKRLGAAGSAADTSEESGSSDDGGMTDTRRSLGRLAVPAAEGGESA
jgi:hypothetical protein